MVMRALARSPICTAAVSYTHLFCNVQDLKGSIQSYVARDCIGEDEYKAFKKKMCIRDRVTAYL